MKETIILRIWILLITHFAILSGSVKVAIKAHNGDWCIRIKDSRALSLEKCYWKLNTATKITETEQIFDVHPEEEDLQEDENTGTDGGKSSAFLIRTSIKPKNSPVGKSCISALSSNLTIGRCDGRTSKFRFSGIFLKSTSNNTDSCHAPTYYPEDFRFKVHSFYNCLESATRTGDRSKVGVSMTKCTSSSNYAQLWQFCTKNGNCSMSPSQFKWDSLIKMEYPNEMNKENCREREISSTTSTTTPATTTTTTTTITSTPTASTLPVEIVSVTSINNTTSPEGDQDKDKVFLNATNTAAAMATPTSASLSPYIFPLVALIVVVSIRG